MSSIFSGYNIAVSGMKTSQTGLAVTSHNIANVNTEGYTRQTMISEDCYTLQLGGISLGSGTDIEEIKQLRNRFLDRTYQQQNAKLGYWGVKSAGLEEIELALAEFSSDDGTASDSVSQTIQDFFNSWEELSKDPSSLTARQNVIEYGDLLVNTFSQLDNQLKNMQEDLYGSLIESVEVVNTLAENIAGLNQQIVELENLSISASDLRDERNRLIDELSGLTSITVQEHENGSVDISIGGITLVSGQKTHSLMAVEDPSLETSITLEWKDLEQEASISGGKLLAYLEEVNQIEFEGIGETDIPLSITTSTANTLNTMRRALNTFITTLAVKVNTYHISGTGLDGSTGLDFFVPIDENEPLSILNMQVNQSLEDTDKVAVSSSGEGEDNSVAQQILELADAEDFQFDDLSMDYETFYEAVVSWLGTTSSSANSFYENQSNLTEQVENQRQSISSVSLDEEMSKMIIYQNAYSASARLLSTIDSLVEYMIQELG